MLALILSLIGVGGVGAAAIAFPSFGALLAGLGKSAAGVLKDVPAKVWYALAIVAALIGGYLYHQHRVHRHDAALVASTAATVNAAWQKAFDKERDAARLWKQAFDINATAISNDERKIHDQAVADNAAAADALRLHGPGAASAAHCGPVDHPAPAAVASGHIEAAPVANASGHQVPPVDGQDLSVGHGFAIVPWDWLVGRAQEHDDLLDAERTRNDTDAKQRAAWEKMLSDLKAAAKGAKP